MGRNFLRPDAPSVIQHSRFVILAIHQFVPREEPTKKDQICTDCSEGKLEPCLHTRTIQSPTRIQVIIFIQIQNQSNEIRNHLDRRDTF